MPNYYNAFKYQMKRDFFNFRRNKKNNWFNVSHSGDRTIWSHIDSKLSVSVVECILTIPDALHRSKAIINDIICPV
jgi:hypothetical protein